VTGFPITADTGLPQQSRHMESFVLCARLDSELLFALADRRFGDCGDNYPVIANNRLRAIHRFESANSVTTCAVFFAKPRKRTFTSPN
jgi:hypothetical protein